MPDWMKSTWVEQSWNAVAPHVPSIALALGILIGGWLIALILRAITFAALKRTTVDDRIAEALGVETSDDRVERAVSRFVYYVALAFVVVAFFDRLQVSAVTTPIVEALSGLSGAVPSILKAVLIGFVGFVVATLVRKGLVAVLDRTSVVSKLEEWSGVEREKPKKRKKGKKRKRDEDEEPASTSETIGNVAFWVIIVLTAIPVLEALEIGVLAAPLQSAISVVATYLPKIFGAALLAALGYFLGRIAQVTVRTLIDKTGVDRALARVGLGGVLGEQTAGSILGTLALVFILLHFAISAVGRLQIEEISGPLGSILTQIYAFLPRLLVGALLLAVGVALARIAARFARGVLAAVGFNALMAHIGLYEPSAEAQAQEKESRKLLEARLHGEGKDDEEEDEESDEVDPLIGEKSGFRTPADIGGIVVGAIVVVLFFRQALQTMGLEGLAAMFDALIGYLPSLLVAAIVLGAGMWAGRWARDRLGEITSRTDDRLVKTLPTIAHVGVVVVAAMVALQQLGVGNQIIAIAFTLVLGAVCLAAALAFGLGGREVASKILEREYDKRQK